MKRIVTLAALIVAGLVPMSDATSSEDPHLYVIVRDCNDDSLVEGAVVRLTLYQGISSPVVVEETSLSNGVAYFQNLSAMAGEDFELEIVGGGMSSSTVFSGVYNGGDPDPWELDKTSGPCGVQLNTPYTAEAWFDINYL